MKDCILFLSIFIFLGVNPMANAKTLERPSEKNDHNAPIKLIFIHHSVGGNWLAHNYGGLVSELNKNNYYVNDVSYGWEPSILTDNIVKKIKRKILGKLGRANQGAYGIGNRTDIGQMPDWFLGPDSDLIMGAIYSENRETDIFGDHSNSTSSNPIPNPGEKIENQIVMFKSCFPNTLLRGNPDDSAAQLTKPVRNFTAASEDHTVANAKRLFNDILTYFRNHPDKFFVIITPSPQAKLPKEGKIARGFCNWLVYDWLKENEYQYKNVMVFDLFNVLTSGHSSSQNDFGQEDGNHHRIWNGKVQHIVNTENNLLVYPTKDGDDHPSPAGLQKATQEFVPLLNHYVELWQGNLH